MYKPSICEEEEKTLYYGFYFDALVSGFNKADRIYFKFVSPNYVTVFCNVPSESNEEQRVNCYVNVDEFPIFQEQLVTLPENLQSYKDVSIEDWNKYFGQNLKMNVAKCSRTVTYSFTLNNVFNMSCDNDGQNILSSAGKFQTLPNSLHSSVSITYKFKPFIYSDDAITHADCYIVHFPDENASEEDEIKCAIIGSSKALFFQTSSLVENDRDKYMVFNLG